MDTVTILDGYAEITGWNEDSKILILTDFVDFLSKRRKPINGKNIEDAFDSFLRGRALDEGVSLAELSGEEPD